MANTNKNGKSFTKNLTMVAILTAITVVLQIVALVSRPFLPFSITLSLFPIVIGAALCGPVTSSWLGFAFGITVLLSGDAAAFPGKPFRKRGLPGVYRFSRSAEGSGSGCGLHHGARSVS